MTDPRIEESKQKALDLLKATQAQIERGLDLHSQFLVCDCFGFAPYSFTANMVRTVNRMIDEGASMGELSDLMLDMRITEQTRDPDARQLYEAAWRAAGVTCMMQTEGSGENIEGTIIHMARFEHVCDRMRDFVFKATSVDDARAAKADGRHCLVGSLNGPPCAAGPRDVDKASKLLTMLHRYGIRMMHLTYNQRNFVGDGCVERGNGGLSEFGREVARRMSETGIVVDTPHSGRQTTLDATRFAGGVVAASHSSCDAVYHHDRAKTDEEIKAIADTGGLIGMYVIPTFLAEAGNITHLLDHIDHAAKLVGTDHIGIGTDTTYTAPPPEGLELKPFPKTRETWQGNWRPEHRTGIEGISDECRPGGSLAWTNWPCFTIGLVTRGYSDEDIEKIIGGNMLRVLETAAGQANIQ